MEAAGECHSVSSLDLWHLQEMQRQIDLLAWIPWANSHHNSALCLAVMHWAWGAFQAEFWFPQTRRHFNVFDWNQALLLDLCLQRTKGAAARAQLVMRMSCRGAGFSEKPSEMASPWLLQARADSATYFLTKLQRLFGPAKRQWGQICCVPGRQAMFDVHLLPDFAVTRPDSADLMPFAVTRAFTFSC